MKDNRFFLDEIKNSDSIVIYAHHFPDGDCVGSEMGLKKIILENFPGKQVYAVGENSKKWSLLLGKTDEANDDAIVDSLAIIVDHNSFDRCGDKRVLMAKRGIRFDHHIEGLNPFPFPSIVNPDAVSASQVVLEWVLEMKLRIPLDAINDLYTAFLDDKKQYSSSNIPENAKEIEELFLSLGADYALCKSRVAYIPEEETVYERKILESMVEKGPICFAIMHQNDYSDLGLDYEQAGNKSSFLLKNCKADIALLFTYYLDEIRLSARSRGDYSVQRLCAHFGGGGHHQAAGVVFKSEQYGPEDVISRALEDLRGF